MKTMLFEVSMSIYSKLKSMFYESFDESRVTTLLSRLAPMSEQSRRGLDQFIGEGSHFQSFSASGLPLDLVVNVAKASFMKGGDVHIKQWCEAMTKARSIESDTLIPPMVVVKHAGLIAVVMPKGQDVDRDAAKSVGPQLLATAKALGGAGLVLDDYPQVRQALGVPFIIDWSDLALAD
jgi:hypothetical protein